MWIWMEGIVLPLRAQCWGISGQNSVEVPASLLVPVICRGPVQSTSPGGGLRKAKIVSAVVSSHRRHPAQRTGPSFLCPTNQLLLLLPHSVCQSWAFSAQFSLLSMFSCFPKASSSATTLSPCQSQTLRVTCGIWLVKLFLSFQFYPPPPPPKKEGRKMRGRDSV